MLAEARRLLRPDTGRLVVFDGDYASLTFATDAPDGGEATDRAVQRGLIAQPRVMRAMPRLLAGAGFSLDWSRPFILAEIGRRADYFGGFCAAFRVLLPKAGAMTEAEADAFVGGLERDMAERAASSARAPSTPTWRGGAGRRPARGGRARGRRHGRADRGRGGGQDRQRAEVARDP